MVSATGSLQLSASGLTIRLGNKKTGGGPEAKAMLSKSSEDWSHPDVAAGIMSFLPAHSLRSASQVCQAWNAAARLAATVVIQRFWREQRAVNAALRHELTVVRSDEVCRPEWRVTLCDGTVVMWPLLGAATFLISEVRDRHIEQQRPEACWTEPALRAMRPLLRVLACLGQEIDACSVTEVGSVNIAGLVRAGVIVPAHMTAILFQESVAGWKGRRCVTERSHIAFRRLLPPEALSLADRSAILSTVISYQGRRGDQPVTFQQRVFHPVGSRTCCLLKAWIDRVPPAKCGQR
mmetsp:Transcript_29168/g.69658  ORF Transcript_29168/g.69658 Transcript_29168/m.69658 type:complete len:293 (-) Transcript_29168:118-996(-)